MSIVTRDSQDDWELRLGYQLGYGTGYEIGWAHGFEARDRELQAVLGVVRSTLSTPRQSELQESREHHPGEPCERKCRRCSKCTHSLAYWRRGGRDFKPGDRS
jgi:hypothetical protein